MAHLADMEDPLARSGRRVLDDQPAAVRVDARGQVLPAASVGLLELDLVAGGELPVAPVGQVELAAAEPSILTSRPDEERVEQRDTSMGRPRRRLSRQVIVPASSGGNASGAQSALMPMPMTTRGSGLPRPSALAQNSSQLARPPRCSRSPS